MPRPDATGPSWAHFPHGADIGVRGCGPSRESALEQAALALTAAITDPSTVHASSRVEVSCRAPDDDTLLVDWLNGLIFEMATRHMLFSHFDVRPVPGGIEAQAWGETVDPARHHPAVEPKGATFTALQVINQDGQWCCECVVDV